MKQRQHRDNQAEQFNEMSFRAGVDLERALKGGIIDLRLAKKYIEAEVIKQIFFAGHNFARVFSDGADKAFEMYTKAKKAD